AFKFFMLHDVSFCCLEAIRQTNSSNGKQQPKNHARADIRRSAKPFAFFQHFRGFPTKARKRGVAAEKSDRDRNSPVRGNHHAIQRELADESKQKTSAEIDEQRAIRKSTTHANLRHALQTVARECADGSEECN